MKAKPLKYNIICLSNQLWDFPNWTNKRHVMARLGRSGNQVLFIDPMLNVGNVLLQQIVRGTWKLNRILTQQKLDETGVKIYTPLNIFPFYNVACKGYIDTQEQYLSKDRNYVRGVKAWLQRLVRYLYRLIAKLQVSRIQAIATAFFKPDCPTLLWVYHVETPGLPTYIKELKYDLLVYDCVDNYEGFPLYNTPAKKEWLHQREKFLAETADIVFATTPGLEAKLKRYNEYAYLTPNVGDYELFKDTKKFSNELPDDLKNIPAPRVGFVGALDDYKFDFDLLIRIAKDHPSISFVIIGQLALKDKNITLKSLGLTELANVYFLGFRPYEKKKYYLAGFAAEIIPYRLNEYTVGGCFPVKFHDTLAAGLPCIVTDLPAYAPFKDVCYISKNHVEFSANIERAIKEDSLEKIQDRQEVAKRNGWEEKVANMVSLVTDSLERKQSR